MTSGSSGRRAAGSPAQQVDTTLFRVLIVLRLVVTGYAVALDLVRFHEFVRPGSAGLALAVMVAWTALVSWAYDAPGRRRPWLFVTDLALAVLLVLSTRVVESQAMLDRHASTVPSFWVMAPVLAWAVWRGWPAGVAAAAVVSVADLSVRTELVGATWGNIFLLVLAAGVVGYAASALREAAEIRAAAERSAAALEERTRLARVVHDGVLQVLALVQRRAAEADSRLAGLAELGRVAGEQEAALRSLIQYDERTRLRGQDAAATADLMLALEALQSPRVTVAGPAGPVELAPLQVAELSAVVRACLDNVRTHVGADAPAWVFVEDLGGSVVVTVRDEGPGIAEGRLAEAAAEGRLGVRSSICGRMADLGATATLITAPGAGTEWELTLPRS